MNEHPDDRNALTPETLTAYFDAGHPAEQRLAEEGAHVFVTGRRQGAVSRARSGFAPKGASVSRYS